MKPEAKQKVGRTKTTPLASARDGSWMDEWGACRVCDGEIPHGHSNNCDIYKMGRKITRYETLLRRVLEWCDQESPNFEIDADAIRTALNPPNAQDQRPPRTDP